MAAVAEVRTEGRREGERVVRKGRERDGGKLLLGIVVFRKIAFKSLSSRGHTNFKKTPLTRTPRTRTALIDRTHPEERQSCDDAKQNGGVVGSSSSRNVIYSL